MEKRNAEKAEASLSHDVMSESYRPKKLLLRDARENDAAALCHFTRGYDQHERYGNVWRRIRDRHLAGHPLCECCKERGRYVLATLVHHIRPISDGGTNDERNLMSLCVSCHEKIHQRKAAK